MSQQDSSKPDPCQGKKAFVPGYMADMQMRKVALRGALATVEQEFEGKEKPSPKQLMRMAVTLYRSSLQSRPYKGMLG